MPTPIKVSAKVTEIIQHADDRRSFILQTERRVPAFAPGQFLHLAIDAYEPGMHWPESRVYSIASSPFERERIRVTISRQGAFTSRMFAELVVGSRVWLKLPYGTFCPSTDAPGPIVLIAGGSGITPFISFLAWAAVERPNASVELHYGVRSSNLLIYRQAINQIREAGLGGLRVTYYVEQTSEHDVSVASLVHGRLSVEHIWAGNSEPKNSRFFLSGPKVMIDDFRRQLIQLGASPESVLSDDWA